MESNIPSDIQYFEAYIDESGDFVSADADWLVGGYMLPINPPEIYVSQRHSTKIWRKALAIGQDIHRKTNPDVDYNFTHCSSNSSTEAHLLRKIIQKPMLESMIEDITEQNGNALIFFSAKGDSGPSKELNYLTVLARGYAQLFAQMQEKHPGCWVVPMLSYLNLGFYKGDPNLIDEDHHEEETRLIRQQISAIMYIAASENIPDDEARHALRSSLKYLSILRNYTRPCVLKDGRDFNPQAKYSEDPFKDIKNIYNVISDYICNSYYSDYQGEFRSGPLADVICYPVNRQNLVEYAKKEHLDAAYDTRVPSAMYWFLDSEGLIQFNAADFPTQRLMIQQLCNEIHPVVERQLENMETVYNEMADIIALGNKIQNEQARHELNANLLLYMLATLNHAGRINEVAGFSIKFLNEAAKIQDDICRNNLMSMYYNRQIVISTDRFDYEQAEKYFLQMQNYWQNYLKHYIDRFSVLNEDESPKYAAILCAGYGRTIGSILQNTRQLLRRMHGVEKFKHYMTALNRAFMAKLQYDDPRDLVRLEITLCDLESEAGFYKEAFAHLIEAAAYSTGLKFAAPADITAENCAAVLDATGVFCNFNPGNPYLLFCYVRLCAEMFIAGDHQDASVLLQALMVNEESLKPAFYKGIYAIHPRSQIMWKLATASAHNGMRGKANALYNAAYSQLVDERVPIFTAIAIALRAEQASFGLGNIDELLFDIQEKYRWFLEYKPMDMNDPFAEFKIEEMIPDEQILTRLFDLSRVIAY